MRTYFVAIFRLFSACTPVGLEHPIATADAALQCQSRSSRNGSHLWDFRRAYKSLAAWINTCCISIVSLHIELNPSLRAPGVIRSQSHWSQRVTPFSSLPLCSSYFLVRAGGARRSTSTLSRRGWQRLGPGPSQGTVGNPGSTKSNYLRSVALSRNSTH